jgi:hypothetical protein
VSIKLEVMKLNAEGEMREGTERRNESRKESGL